MHLTTEAVLAHLNPRREKAGENDGPVAFDAKITATLPIDALGGLFATELGLQQLAAHWREDGELVTGEWALLTLAREGSGLEATFSGPISGTDLTFRAVELDKIRLKPEGGRKVALTARMILHPSQEQVGQLCEWLNQTVLVAITQPQMEIPIDQAAPKRRGKKADAQPKPGDQKGLQLDQSSPMTSVADCVHEWKRPHPGGFHFCVKCQIEREMVEPGYDRDPNKPLPSEVAASFVCDEHQWDVPDDPDAICLKCGASKAELEFDSRQEHDELPEFTEPPEEGAQSGETIQ